MLLVQDGANRAHGLKREDMIGWIEWTLWTGRVDRVDAEDWASYRTGGYTGEYTRGYTEGCAGQDTVFECV